MKKKKILIVEDEHIIAEDLKEQLLSLGYQVFDIITSGEQAIKKAKELKPDLVLMDILLHSEIDGIEAAQEIYSRLDIPTVYITALGDENTIKRAKLTEPYGYIMKPFGREELRISIEIALYKYKMDKKLRESEERLNTVVSNAPIVMWALDKEGIFILSEGLGLKTLGLRSGEVVGQSVFDVYCDAPKIIEDNRRALAGESFVSIIEVGELVFESHYSPLRDKSGEVIGMIGVSTDITERKQTEKALQESEEKYRTLTDNVNIGVYRNTVGPIGKFIEVNPAIIKMFGYKNRKQFLGINVADLYQNPEDRKKFNEKMLKDGFVKDEELRLKKKDGTLFFGSVSTVAVKDGKGKVIYYDGIIDDITEHKQAEELLKRSHEELRNLTVYIDTKMEEEKKKTARKIHDGLGQLLTGIKMSLTLLGKNISDKQNTAERLDSMKKMLDSGIYLVQNISKDLRPAILDDLGIIAALQTQIADFEESSGIKCDFICLPKHFTIETDLALSIYRIFLEIFTNIIRHAKAKKVSIRFQKQKTKISLNIKDYGVGITEEQISSSISFGLISIRERLNIWKGKMKIEGISGKGTTVKIQIPI